MARRYTRRLALEANLLEVAEARQFVKLVDVLNFSESSFQSTARRLIMQRKLEKVAHGVYAKPGTSEGLSPLERLALVHPLAPKVIEHMLARGGEWTPGIGRPDGKGYPGLRYLSGARSPDSFRNAMRALVQAGALKKERRGGVLGYIAAGAPLLAASIERSDLADEDKAAELDYLAYREKLRIHMARQIVGTPEWRDRQDQHRIEVTLTRDQIAKERDDKQALADLLS